MGVRDDELNRLIRYAQGMGLSVRFKPYVRGGHSAEWLFDGSEITIYVTTQCSKIEKILSLIHELSHHRAWIANERQMDPKVEEAILSEEDKKSYRKRIYEMEKADSVYWVDIYKDTNCKFDINKLYLQRDFDLHQYEVYYNTGKFPKGKEKKKKYRELKKKYL
jgi:prolyl oligopeptidase PreP (S9A serine peptidase family)